MAKKRFIAPFVLMSSTPTDETEYGGGTGQTTTDPFPCSFADYQSMFEYDHDMDGDMDFDDYGQWWADNGFSVEVWEQFNPGVPFVWE